VKEGVKIFALTRVASLLPIPLVIIFSVLDFLGSGFWEIKRISQNPVLQGFSRVVFCADTLYA
jgi:hypothetical protein